MSIENEPLNNDDYQTNSYQNAAGHFASSSFKNAKNFFNEKVADFTTSNNSTTNNNTNDRQMTDENGKPRRREVVHLFCGDVDQDLLISKLFYLFFYAAFGSLFPLISIYFKQLGMNAVQASLLVGVRPFVEFASIPMWGFLADKYRKAKVMLIFSLLAWIVSTLILNYFHPLTPYCLVDNGTYATLQASKVVYTTADNTNYDFSNIKLRNYQRPELYVEQNRTPGMSPVYLNHEIVDNYPRDVDDGDLVKPPFSTKVYRKSSVEQTFMLFFLIIVIGEFCSAPAITLADACTLSYLGDHPEFYGKQRMFGSIGWAVAMFIIGIALDHSLVFSSHPCGQTDLHEKNYTTCFAAFSVLMGCALLISFLFRFDDIKTQRPDKVSKVIMDIRQTEISPAVAENARARAPEAQEAAGGRKWMSVLKTFSSAPHAAFLFVAWWFGFGVGLVFCFLFWHLQDIGGSPTLYGFASVINHSSEIFAYFFSYRLINTYGHMKVLYIGLLANVFRFLYVSWLTDPWWVLPFEFVQGITHAAVWAAATSYISLAAPPQYKSSAQGLLQNLHHAIGRASGTLIGGIIIHYKGTRFAFQFYGCFCAIILAAFYAINRLMKVSGFKYQSDGFEDEITHTALDPHGIPMMVPYSKSEEKLAPSDNVGAYGATDATQEAYDRYIHEPYDKPVKFESFPSNFARRGTLVAQGPSKSSDEASIDKEGRLSMITNLEQGDSSSFSDKNILDAAKTSLDDYHLPKTLRECRSAFAEFYLSLILIQNYQQLNGTGFRKILKKHDKLLQTDSGHKWYVEKVSRAPFFLNKEIDNLIANTERIVTEQIEDGNRQAAMKRLRVPPLSEAQSAWTTYRLGFFMGSFLILVFLVILTIFLQERPEEPRWLAVRLFRGFLLLFANIFLMGVNMYGWQISGVNHVLIFEIDPRDHLTYQSLMEISAFFATIWALCVLGYLHHEVLHCPAAVFPLILLTFCLIWLFLPVPYFLKSSRFWFIRHVYYCFTAPFYKVTFPDFWLADQMNSLITFFLDMEYFGCFYANHVDYSNGFKILINMAAPDETDVFDSDHVTITRNASISLLYNKYRGINVQTGADSCLTNVFGIRPIISCLPALIRFLQCIRRYKDTKNKHPHLSNAGKYATTFFIVIFGSLNTYYKRVFGDNGFFYVWVLSYIVSYVYTLAWDIKMDWSLFDTNQKGAQNRFLRDDIIYQRWLYYAAIVEDAILRLAWVFNVSVGDAWLSEIDLLMFITAPLEIVRRFVWNFFRLENEHVNNCGQFRATRDIHIAPISRVTDWGDVERKMSDDDGVTHRGEQFNDLHNLKLKTKSRKSRFKRRLAQTFKPVTHHLASAAILSSSPAAAAAAAQGGLAGRRSSTLAVISCTANNRNSMASEDSNNFFGSKRSLLPIYKKKSKFEVLEAKDAPGRRVAEEPSSTNVNFAPYCKSSSPSRRVIEVSRVELDPMKGHSSKDNGQAQPSCSITFTLPNDLDV